METIILFIRAEDRKKLVNQFWGFGPDGISLIDNKKQSVYMKAEISVGTLCYSWGSSRNGKLGNCTRDENCEKLSGFLRQD